MTKKKQNSFDLFLETLLKEDVPPPVPQTSQDFAPVTPPKNISLDQSIDRYFVRYEKESIPTNEMQEALAIKNKSFLFEQLGPDEEEEPAPEEDAPADDAPADDAGGDLGGGDLGDLGGDLGGDAPADGAAPAAGGQPVVATPKINLNDFARSVARLANNFQALLDPRSTIINRAEAYITNNYDQRTAQVLMQILEVNYSLTPTDVENTATPGESEFPQPYAAGAFGGGAAS